MGVPVRTILILALHPLQKTYNVKNKTHFLIEKESATTELEMFGCLPLSSNDDPHHTPANLAPSQYSVEQHTCETSESSIG
jgi:hypothetical protein